MMEILLHFFIDNPLILQGYEYLWKPGLIWLNILSDLLIALSYYSIAISLIYLSRKQKDFSLNWILILAIALMVSCGTSYIIDLWTMWHQRNWISGAIAILTAILLISTAIVFIPILNKVIALLNLKVGKGNSITENGRSCSDRDAIAEIEIELAKTNSLLTAVIDGIPDPIFIKDIHGRYLMVNSATIQVFRKPLAEVIGKNDLDLFPPEIGQKLMETDREIITTGIGKTFEEVLTGNDRITRTYLSSKTLHKDANGNIMGVLGIARDITDLKKAESALEKAKDELEIQVENRTAALTSACRQLQKEMAERQTVELALRESEAQYRCLIETAAEGIWILDPNGKTTFANPTMAKMLGYSVEEMMGLSLFDFMDESEKASATQNLERRCQGVMETHDFKFRCKDGSDLWTLVAANPILDDSGEYIGALGMITDITQRRQAEEALRESEKHLRAKTIELEEALQEIKQTQSQLIQAEKMSSLGILIAGVAHEINGPVGFIYGNIIHINGYAKGLLELINLYQDNYPDPGVAIQEKIEEIELYFIREDLPKLISSMKIGADRVVEIIKGLRNFSRDDKLEMTEVDIHEAIDNSLLILNHRLKAKSNRSEIEVIKQYGNLPKIQGYTGQLNQVFLNILSNGIDAIEEVRNKREKRTEEKDTSLQFRIKILTNVKDSNSVEIRIIDNGIGMAKDVQGMVFDPFFTTKPVGKGTGLGLSISYQIIVEKHRGKLQCISTLGEGTEFAINLPIQLEEIEQRMLKTLNGEEGKS
ncbi:MAG TPA: PAS domain-containing sensor histidine kinase [Cyanobacteria bacterium UBA11149]|nr:PAS domain-containing sensor histidine kinase [Cyanobacteria bacterium UBA11367]HBE59552.1 PAS domain-containing sensor histidine kinase [Cyanobacteria bacterium UBA11366]HBK64324.1 PAS domain-containing sensor histidine kinase [Cyanobacteria bacterium UBA11166]HBR75567.1 PAS domain-containing sensor histidine kinase [Cyanobacteria bacterium UBA11159]HBS72129.1 PAS domain-containing sensor histidine kinase [Cyanobacteria bacterium UBA11153]HBW88287.1 PAS domain-containing sensor histidine k